MKWILYPGESSSEVYVMRSKNTISIFFFVFKKERGLTCYNKIINFIFLVWQIVHTIDGLY